MKTAVMGTNFECPPHYQKLKAIGLGAFGLVCSAYDSQSSENVAIKKLSDPFANATHGKRVFRELMLLAHFRHENIIQLKDVFLDDKKGDLYFVTELLGADLQRLLQLKPLGQQYIRFFSFQILRGLRYIHAAGVIHRDLKPANILVSENCDLRICDFGLARVEESVMTGYVATRYYRAPEIMLNWQRYDKAIDLWSFGCILAEMLEGKKNPVFPGKDHIDQFSFIAEMLGSPPAEVVESISSASTLKFVQSLKHFEHQTFETRFPQCDTLPLDLVRKILVWDPSKRYTAVEAIGHPYFVEYEDADDKEEVDAFDWSFMEEDIGCDEWKGRVLEVIAKLAPERLDESHDVVPA